MHFLVGLFIKFAFNRHEMDSRSFFDQIQLQRVNLVFFRFDCESHQIDLNPNHILIKICLPPGLMTCSEIRITYLEYCLFTIVGPRTDWIPIKFIPNNKIFLRNAIWKFNIKRKMTPLPCNLNRTKEVLEFVTFHYVATFAIRIFCEREPCHTDVNDS